ncbi:MAG: tRNA uridine-5-carboxymethylaminomethyl(34) synthesis GTPase MnmE, partial [Lachnospiraceae bacterium]|nr:tRNA uridine-5-carboxymethylaminomethyl(34) synthesis GTPase MnmE [Lachnospiraceae bacterium]
HGGIYVASKVLRSLIDAGCKMAEPGEFTKRAFLNGKMDLTQAEAVMNIIRADNDRALDISLKQLDGDLSKEVKRMRDIIIHENAYIEYALDDPEHVSLDGYSDKLSLILDDILNSMKHLIDTADEGRIVNEGIKTVIVGKPNAGKSSLLNNLLKEERAIVTDIPGTTRDTLEERVVVSGIPLNIVDTAGIRDTKDVVEKIGVDKAKASVDKADLIIFVIDGSDEISAEDREIADIVKDKEVIVIVNKTDINENVNDDDILNMFNKDTGIIRASMKDKTGIDDLAAIIKEKFISGDIKLNSDALISNERQKNAMVKAYEALLKVKESIELSLSEDFYTVDLLDAYEYLGEIIGERYQDDLADRIFSDFCVGK